MDNRTAYKRFRRHHRKGPHPARVAAAARRAARLAAAAALASSENETNNTSANESPTPSEHPAAEATSSLAHEEATANPLMFTNPLLNPSNIAPQNANNHVFDPNQHMRQIVDVVLYIQTNPPTRYVGLATMKPCPGGLFEFQALANPETRVLHPSSAINGAQGHVGVGV